jgi:hypothetical protein
MSSSKEAREAADRLMDIAGKFLDDSNQKTIEVGKTRIEINRVALKNGNVMSKIGSMSTPGELFVDRTLDLKNPPIDSPDVAEMIRLTSILEISSSIGKF